MVSGDTQIMDDWWFFDKIGMHDDFTQYVRIVLLILVLVFTVGLFLFMRYVLKKEKFRLGTIIVALSVAFIVIMPGFFLAMDASLPYERKKEMDPDFKYMGSFGSSFTSEYWESGMDWLAEQDETRRLAKSLAFVELRQCQRANNGLAQERIE